MYSVETGDDASEQIAALPKEGLLSFASLVDLLEIHPWSGDSYNRKRPDANMRAHAFGDPSRPPTPTPTPYRAREGLASTLFSKISCVWSSCRSSGTVDRRKTGLRSSFTAVLGHCGLDGTGVKLSDPSGRSAQAVTCSSVYISIQFLYDCSP